MRKLLKKYDLDSFEVILVSLMAVCFMVSIIEYYFNLFRGML